MPTKIYSKDNTQWLNIDPLPQSLKIKLGFLLKPHIFTIQLNIEREKNNTLKMENMSVNIENLNVY